jgi:ankyrin repeat protein
MITPLEFAARYHRYEVILPLLKGGALDYPDINASVLHEVSNLPSYESWATGGLLGLRPDEAAGLCTSILLDWCPHLLEQGDTSGYGTTPLMTACYYHSQVVVQCLIERKCNINARSPFEYDGRTALNFYSNNQLTYVDNDILDLLHMAGADLELCSASGKTPLHFAARDDNVRVARRLLELGAQLDSKTNEELTPLHTAAIYGATHAGQLLIDAGADLYAQHERGTLNEKDWSGLTPLAMAISRRQRDFVDLLLEDRYHLDPVARPATADTIVHFAVPEQNPDLLHFILRFSRLKVKELLDHRNLKGVTALHLAAGNRSRQKHIELLIDAGVDVSLTLDTGHTVLDIMYQTRELVRTEIDQGM